MEATSPNPGERKTADAETRRQLTQRCESSKTRSVGRPPDHPSRWQPGTVRHPETGELFDTMSAWPFIAACLQRGAEIEVIALDQPEGKKGYVMKIDGYGDDIIYIKLEFSSKLVIGRSFHVSDKSSKKNEFL